MVVFVIEKFVKVWDKIFKDVLDVLELIRVVIDVIVLVGVVNFELNMWCRDNIKFELNEDYKYLCFSLVFFIEFLFGNDVDLFK